MSFIAVYGVGFGVVLACMVALWMLSLVLKNASIVDVFWGTGFVIANWVFFALAPGGFAGRKWLISILVTVWGLRLSLYILWRNASKPEDFRYQKWRNEEGARWWWLSFFRVFLLQGMLLWIIAIPLLAAQASAVAGRLTVFDVAGVAVWIIGFFFEAVGDVQLARFKVNPANKGKVLDRGVWHYTRHPNYFGDAAQWWGYYLIAAAAGGFWTIYSPVIMTLFLLKVSGVALLEKTLKETKPQYKTYIETTSSFIPWPPRRPK